MIESLMDTVSSGRFRARWLREPSPEAEKLFSMVADIFIFWAKSHVRAIHHTPDLLLHYI